MTRWTQLAFVLGLFGFWALPGAGQLSAEPRPCGYLPGDWCPSKVRGDRCNRHTTKEACMADRRCYGIAYRGVSFVPCFIDKRGFPENCPTVGCTSRRPPPYRIREGMICLNC